MADRGATAVERAAVPPLPRRAAACAVPDFLVRSPVVREERVVLFDMVGGF
jgi:hypothetical protein